MLLLLLVSSINLKYNCFIDNAIEEFITIGLQVKHQSYPSDYAGVNIKQLDKDTIFFLQPSLIITFIKDIGIQPCITIHVPAPFSKDPTILYNISRFWSFSLLLSALWVHCNQSMYMRLIYLQIFLTKTFLKLRSVFCHFFEGWICFDTSSCSCGSHFFV